MTVASRSDRRQTRKAGRPVVLLVPVPGGSPIHDLWAGTKLLVVFAISALLAFYPGWVTIAFMSALVVAAIWIARIPRGALPSIPRWLWIVLALGGITAALAGGSPLISVDGIEVGLGGLLNFLRITTLTVLLLALGGLVSFTTNVAEIGPAVATLGRPLRLLRLPVDEWAVALALALRAFPMLIDEFQVLNAARRLRPKRIPKSRKERRQQRRLEVIDLLAAAISVTLRRADEMGDAITARGGTGQLSANPRHPKLADWMTIAITVVAGSAGMALQTLLNS
ncbi:energy-coupling factor transporter transmembrane protein EcfT [Mycobacterium vicinigordonae]|uniref:Energy-coupling factor transporter transmembrane protein EcfT n=1 Tax=Mycobacterium vicinigordonae TaxID=1719132 RepID=A0A7D6DWT0_9MYCO|nr:energy-coupling factor transporter transmembrane protein EcfT [Mycobacterium vicinigordonae]QLL05750.1 energy-coupling factor transporter transmembrane protein EcfT [Mycobacterium vicinigordonae]